MITISNLIQEVRRLAKENPNYIYEKPDGFEFCSYLSSKANPNRGCIFGIALLNLDVCEEFELKDCRGIEDIIMEKFSCLEPDSFVKIDWCKNVQQEQDEGYEWGKSVECVDDRIGVV